jgi:quercetin dioxygenase-like cupin family protein
MELVAHPFSSIDWNVLEHTSHAGASGEARWRTMTIGDTRIRMVEYSPGYLADHWCARGHILLVLDGELRTELDDGRIVQMTAGHSYQVGSGMEAHRSSTEVGARLFIVD